MRATVGYERVMEIENPELARARARELYQAKGYPQAWIEKRLRLISVRGELTDEWKARGVAEGKEYSILTAAKNKALSLTDFHAFPGRASNGMSPLWRPGPAVRCNRRNQTQ